MDKPTDFNDMQVMTSPENVEDYFKKQISNTQDPSLMPEGFHVDKTGLYYDDKKISSYLQVIAWCRSPDSKNWCKLIELYDPDNIKHEVIIPAPYLKGDCSDLKSELLNYGVRFEVKTQNIVCVYVLLANPKSRITTIKRAGWHGTEYYLPGSDLFKDKEFVFDGCQLRFEGFESKGTLEEWQNNIASHCIGNSRLLFALSIAFSGPILSLCGEESLGYNFNGPSSIGKSITLTVANSACGSPKRIRSWRSTSNALEATAEAFNDSTLFLDELGEVYGKALGQTIYMLGNGQGKTRMKRDTTNREALRWSLAFLSTGEVSLADKLKEAGENMRAGMGVRMIDIPADAERNMGIFENIHEFESSATFAKMLDQNVKKYYGTAFPAFIKMLAHKKDNIKERIDTYRQSFLEKCQNVDNVGQMDRIFSKFAFIAASGELAIEFGTLPFQGGTMIGAAYQCLEAHIEFRGHIGLDEVNTALDRLKLFIDQHHASRFILVGKNVDKPKSDQLYPKLAGYVRHIGDDFESPCEFFIFPAVLKDEILKGLNVKSLYKHFIEMGILYPGNNGTPYVSKYFNGRSKRFYHFAAEVFCDG